MATPAIEFYYLPASPPARSVLLAAKALGVKLDCKLVNVMTGEHMKPEYIAMNPQHTIPMINDNGFILWESRAIIQYLANKYGKDEYLYPKDPVKRAVVDHRMYFDAGTLYDRFFNYVVPFAFGKEEKLSDEKKARVEEALAWLDGFIEKSGGWVAGQNMTIADFAIASSVSSMDATGLFELGKYPNIREWMPKCMTNMPGYPELNHDGAQMFGGFVKKRLEATEKKD